MREIAMLVVVAALLAGCGGEPVMPTPAPPPGPPPGPAPAPAENGVRAAVAPTGPKPLPADLAKLIDARCQKCHSGAEPGAGLVLTPDAVVASFVGKPSKQATSRMLVAPGDPDASYLIDKLLGRQKDAGGRGVQMPKKGELLAPAEIELFRAWIKSL